MTHMALVWFLVSCAGVIAGRVAQDRVAPTGGFLMRTLVLLTVWAAVIAVALVVESVAA